jgi:poly(3-hydroxybutyrate) depolymerase
VQNRYRYDTKTPRILPKKQGSTLHAVLLAFVFLTVASPAQERAASEQKLATEFCVVELDGRLHPYRIFFPSRYVPAPEKEGGSVPKFPLVIACHPGGGDEHSYFEWKGNADRIQTIAEERGYIVACPAAPANNWHETAAGSEFGFACKKETPGVIMAVVREIIRQRQVDESRVYLMGASSGGIATYVTAARNPGVFAAVAGVCAFLDKDIVDGLAKTPVLMVNAQKDRNFAIDKIREQKTRLEAAGGKVRLVEVPGGHGGYRDLATYKILFDWFDAHGKKADPRP